MIARGEYTVSPLADGATGAAGRSVSSITEEYYLSTSKTAQADGSWVTTPPVWSAGKYMWTRSKIVYANPAGTEYTTPLCDSSWEAVNELGIDDIRQDIDDTNEAINSLDQAAISRMNAINATIDQLNTTLIDITNNADTNNEAVSGSIDAIRNAIDALNDEKDGILNGLADIETRREFSDKYIRIGEIITDASGEKRAGVAIGENLTLITDEDGDVVVERVGIACTIVGDRVSFWQLGEEIAYFASGEMWVRVMRTKELIIEDENETASVRMTYDPVIGLVIR